MSQYLDKDGASRIAENFLSKQAEQDAILANLQFDLKEAEHALVKTIQGPAPLNIRALTRPLDNYLISGNTVQDGTPTPSNPVDVNGVGVRTKNLLKNDAVSTEFRGVQYTVNADKSVTLYGTVGSQVSYLILMGDGAGDNDINNYSTPIFRTGDSLIVSTGTSVLLQARYTDGNYYAIPNNQAITLAKDVGLLYVQVSPRISINTTVYPTITLSTETDTGYEPYGYKLPLIVNGTEYPIYLGQVPTTRRIKKLVLTGNEDWQTQTGQYRNDTALFLIWQRQLVKMRNRPSMNTHFISAETGVNPQIQGFVCSGYHPNADYSDYYYIRPHFTTIGITSETTGLDAITAFKSWLAAQYAAGTPVTVWYILATPETAIVNEPLHKIGDYADTISMAQTGVTLTTTKGFNTITTDTTVLPSNIEVKGVINNA